MDGYILILSDGTPIAVTYHNEAYACALAAHHSLRMYTCDITVYELPSLRFVQTYTHEAPDPE